MIHRNALLIIIIPLTCAFLLQGLILQPEEFVKKGRKLRYYLLPMVAPCRGASKLSHSKSIPMSPVRQKMVSFWTVKLLLERVAQGYIYPMLQGSNLFIWKVIHCFSSHFDLAGSWPLELTMHLKKKCISLRVWSYHFCQYTVDFLKLCKRVSCLETFCVYSWIFVWIKYGLICLKINWSIDCVLLNRVKAHCKRHDALTLS